MGGVSIMACLFRHQGVSPLQFPRIFSRIVHRKNPPNPRKIRTAWKLMWNPATPNPRWSKLLNAALIPEPWWSRKPFFSCMDTAYVREEFPPKIAENKVQDSFIKKVPEGLGETLVVTVTAWGGHTQGIVKTQPVMVIHFDGFFWVIATSFWVTCSICTIHDTECDCVFVDRPKSSSTSFDRFIQPLFNLHARKCTAISFDLLVAAYLHL